MEFGLLFPFGINRWEDVVKVHRGMYHAVVVIF